jgi:hypothetical protein
MFQIKQYSELYRMNKFSLFFQMGVKDVESYKEEKSRDNGWTLPPHPLQIAAWIVLIVFAVFYFVCFVPALHKSWQPAGYIVSFIIII